MVYHAHGILFFLGLCNVFRRLVPSVFCLTALFKKEIEKEMARTFQTTRQKMEQLGYVIETVFINQRLVVCSKRKGQNAIDTDAGYKKIDCVRLENREDGSNRPAGYFFLCCEQQGMKTVHKYRQHLEASRAINFL